MPFLQFAEKCIISKWDPSNQHWASEIGHWKNSLSWLRGWLFIGYGTVKIEKIVENVEIISILKQSFRSTCKVVEVASDAKVGKSFYNLRDGSSIKARISPFPGSVVWYERIRKHGNSSNLCTALQMEVIGNGSHWQSWIGVDFPL